MYVLVLKQNWVNEWLAGSMGGWMNGNKELHYFMEEIIVKRKSRKRERGISSLAVWLEFWTFPAVIQVQPESLTAKKNKNKKQNHNKVGLI